MTFKAKFTLVVAKITVVMKRLKDEHYSVTASLQIHSSILWPIIISK